MSVEIKVEIVGDLIKHLESIAPDSDLLARLKEMQRWRPSGVILEAHDLTMEAAQFLAEAAKAIGERGLQMQCTGISNVMADPEAKTVSRLQYFEAACVAWLKKGAIKGWLFGLDANKHPVPWLVDEIKFCPARNKEDRPFVSVSLSACRGSTARESRYNSRQGQVSESITLFADRVVGMTVPQIMAEVGLFHETDELHHDYEAAMQAFAKIAGEHGKQFVIDNHSTFTEVNRMLSRQDIASSGLRRVINDDDLVERAVRDRISTLYWIRHGMGEVFNTLPVQPYLHVFDLGLHKNIWAHPLSLRPYAYDKSLAEKLILPPDHRDLLDALVSDLDVFSGDIIAGKSGGTIVLCTGGPGLGKTLTAEAYSEIVSKPLYRVHSGQLGVDADDIEKNLQAVLKRAGRWNAILLLDEADVYVRQRGDDVVHNAIVAAFLRTMEYFDGLMFMTSNRAGDIDDAIKSRCIAHVKYETPSPESSRRIWGVLQEQFEMGLSSNLLDSLAAHFNQASGRDIKELLKLARRYRLSKGVEYSMDMFMRCAMFRGM